MAPKILKIIWDVKKFYETRSRNRMLLNQDVIAWIPLEGSVKPYFSVRCI